MGTRKQDASGNRPLNKVRIWYLDWILNGQKEVGLQMVRIWNGIWNPKAQPFEIRTNGHFVKNFWNPDKTSGFWMVWFSNGWDYSYSRSPTIWKPDHLKLGFNWWEELNAIQVWSKVSSTTQSLTLILLLAEYRSGFQMVVGNYPKPFWFFNGSHFSPSI